MNEKESTCSSVGKTGRDEEIICKKSILSEKREKGRTAKTPINFRHGHSSNGKRTPTYIVWENMKARVNNPKNTYYSDYGGRGICIDPRWDNFKNFLEDMGERPEGMTLDRKDNSGNYCQINCRWATKLTQANNTRSNRFIEVDGIRLTTAQWAKKIGLTPMALYNRLNKHGWSERRAVTQTKMIFTDINIAQEKLQIKKGEL